MTVLGFVGEALKFLMGVVVGFIILWTIHFFSPLELEHSYIKPELINDGISFTLYNPVSEMEDLEKGLCLNENVVCYYVFKKGDKLF